MITVVETLKSFECPFSQLCPWKIAKMAYHLLQAYINVWQSFCVAIQRYV